MRSFALWYSKKNKESTETNEANVHVNLWDKGKNKQSYCFDFGVLIEDIRNIESVLLYVPFKTEKSQIKDLGAVISNNQLVNAIFNEEFTTTDGEPKRLLVNGTNEKPSFYIYSLEVDKQIELDSCNRSSTTPGTILKIKIGDIQVSEGTPRYYFRIRVQAKRKDIFLINDEIRGVSVFSDQFTNTEVIDFRLNDIRSCSEALREEFAKGDKFGILAVHYLILRNANDVMVHFGKEMNSRMLENDLWKTYIDDETCHMIAYHIKAKAKLDGNDHIYINDFSDLSRFQYQKGTARIIIFYILVIVLLGVVSGVFGNWIYDSITHSHVDNLKSGGINDERKN